MSKVRLTGLIIVSLAATVLSCSPKGPTNTVNIIEKRAELPNGMKLVVMPDPDNTMVQVDVRYEVGAKEDYKGKAGLAHLVEHMMFQHRFGDEGTPIEERPPTFQMLPHIATGFNAYTNWDTTHYYLQAPAEDVEKLLRLEAGRLGMGCKTIPEEQFQREREVVRNEIRQRMGTPEGAVLYQILTNMYPEDHPYHEMIGGNDEQLAAITFDDVCQFMEEYYQPNNATLLVTGNVDPERIGKLAMGYFGGLQKKKIGDLAEVPALKKAYNKKTIEAAIERDVVSVSFPLPSRTSDESDSVNRMLFAMSAILDNLVKEWKIGTVFDSSGTGKEEKLPGITSLGGAYAPIFSIQLELYPGKKPEEALEYIWKAVNMARRNTGVILEDGSFASESLSKTLFKQQMVQTFESLSARNQFMANWIQFDKRLNPDFISDKTWMYEVLNRFGDLEESKYERLVKKVLDKKKATVLVVKASKNGLTGDKRNALAYKAGVHENREKPPVEVGEWDRPLKTPTSRSIFNKIQKYKLENGLNVMLLPYATMPVVTARLIVPGGASIEDDKNAGIADVALRNLRLPIETTAFGRTGVQISGRATDDYMVFNATGMSSYLETTLRGIERLISAGQVSEYAMKDYRDGFKRNFNRESFQRNDAFQRAVYSARFGADHPYATFGIPNINSIDNLSRDTANEYVRKKVKPNGATLIVVGNFDPTYAKKIISKHYSNHGIWKGGKGYPKLAKPVKSQEAKAFGVIGSENAPQVTLSISYTVEPDLMGKYGQRLILAQMLNKRMGMVRSQLGSTYGVRAGYVLNRNAGYYSVSGTIDTNRSGESVNFIRNKIDQLRNGENFKVEFAEARRVVLKRMMAVSNETRPLAGRLTRLAVHQADPLAYDMLVKTIANSTPAQVEKLMQEDLPLSGEILGILGPKATLEKTFSEANVKSPELIDPKI